jgi:hypothetical protein
MTEQKIAELKTGKSKEEVAYDMLVDIAYAAKYETPQNKNEYLKLYAECLCVVDNPVKFLEKQGGSSNNKVKTGYANRESLTS